MKLKVGEQGPQCLFTTAISAKYQWAICTLYEFGAEWELECSADNEYTAERMYQNVVSWDTNEVVALVHNVTGVVRKLHQRV